MEWKRIRFYYDGKGYVKNLFSNGKIEFEGEYINGEKNGKGKEYNYKGELKFEGEYYKGKKWTGNGYYIKDNKLTLAYTLKDGKGIVKEYYDDKLKFEGEYVNGEKNGKAWNER